MKQVFNKRLYNKKQFLKIMDIAITGVPTLTSCKKRDIISKDFESRLMLAVTEVNGCELCSYYHTKEALKLGMSQEDINLILTGNTDNINKDESVAIFFAQHYAETGGNVDKAAYDRLVETYGMEKAKGILAAVRLIMMGNAHGIAFGAFKNRLKGNKVKKSTLHDELSVMLLLALAPLVFFKNIIPAFRPDLEIR